MKSLFKSLSKPIFFAWGQSLAVAIASLTLTLPALGEGSQQLGIGTQGLNVYLFEYDATNGFIQGSNRGIRVNVESAGQVVNISLCGWSYGATAEPRDDLSIEVFRPSGIEIDYTTQVAAGSPGSFLATAANNRGAWLLTQGNARTATQATLCTNQNRPASATGQLTTPVRFVAPEAGTYEIRLYNDTEASNSSNNVLTYFDITVTSSASVNPNPTANNGQVWATSWAFNAGNAFTLAGSYDADLYIRTPGGRPGTEFIWQLDLNRFAPQRHEIVANPIGLNAPNSRASALGTSGATYARVFPIYLSPPNSSSSVAPILPEPAPATVTNLAFVDNADIDNTISPNSTTGIQDSGSFRFNTDVAGAYKITIDTNSNGTFDNSDRVLFGSATAGANSIQWDGRGINNAVLPSGTYQAGVIIGLGEYHFVTFDSETSGGGINDGLSIWKWNSLSARTPALNFWDDTKIATGTSNLVGALSDTPQGKHTWGDFTGAGIGNENFIDTWVFSSSATFQTQAIITATDEDFGDAPDTGAGTGIGNYETITGDNGPRHTIVSGIRLGANIDADSGTLQNATADADDTNGTPNDEDGVTLGGNSLQNQTLNQGANATLNITTQGSGVLNAWIDWNRDGDFIDSGEQIATNTAPTNNAIALTVPVPLGASLGNTYARFRYSSQTGLASTGAASDGEVEDYRVAIASPSTISNPLPCDGNFYQIRVTTGSQLFRINRNFNPYTQTQIGTITPQLTLNALGYNKLDGFMYAIGTGTNQLYRIGQNGAVFLGIVLGLPAADYNTATFDSAGNYYVKEGTSNNIIYKINVATRTATTINLTQSIDLGDMAFHPTDGSIYGLWNTTLYKITLSGTTGTVTTIGSTNIGGSPSVGSVFFDASGTLYGYENNGTFYLINTTNGNATQVSTATPSSVSDGASCPFTAPERVISTVKSVATVSRVNSTTFNVPYTIVVTNTGTDAAPNTQITENLNLTFSTGTPTLTIPSGPTVTNGSCTANTSFNGTTDTKLLTGTNTLAIGSGTCTIAFIVQVAYPNLASVPSTVQNNTVYGSSTSDGPNSGYTFVSGTPIPPPALLSSSQSTIGVTYPTTNVPNLLLVKRITAVNGVDVTGFQDGVNTSGNPNNVGNKAVEDNDSLWPSPNTTSLRGAINSSTIAPVVSFKPGDEVEYTIYFLNKGDSQASNVSICDFVPANQTYVGTGYNSSTFSVDTGGLAGSNYGVVIQSANGAALVKATNALDGDRAQFYTSGFPTSCTGTNGGRGAVVVNLGNVPNATSAGTPANSYGFIRFKAKID